MHGIKVRSSVKGLPSAYERALGRKPRTIPHGTFGQSAIAVRNERWKKRDISRGFQCVYLGPDFSTLDGVWLLNLETGKVISRRTYKLVPGYPFLSDKSNSVFFVIFALYSRGYTLRAGCAA